MPHPKNALIDRAQKLGLARPDFATEKSGPEHEPHFETQVRLSGAVIGRGEGASKRAAEAAAAQAALAHMDAEPGALPKGGGDAPAGKSGKAAKSVKPERSEPATKPAAKPAPKQTPKAPAKSKKPAPGKATEGAGPAPQPAATSAAENVTATAAQAAGTKVQAKPKPRGRGGERPKQAAPVPAAPTEDASEEPFDGPWPMFDDLLAAALQVADRRVPGELKGAAALDAVRDFSLRLYKDLLINLGDVEEEDEDD